MTIRAIAVASALAASFVSAPAAFAQGCSYEHKTQSTSRCLTGQTFDAATQTCVTPASS